jgi:hypothetical protein
MSIDTKEKAVDKRRLFFESGAGNETRTRDLNLGKVALYQLSYSRRDVAHRSTEIHSDVWRRGVESNHPTRICNPLHNRFATAPLT